MLSSAVKRFILPFAPQKSRVLFNAEVEGAAVYALTELERMKGGGLIIRQPEEKILFLAKMGYPLWLFPKNETTYIFDGLNNSAYAVSYFELPSAKVFMDSLETNLNTREDFMAFLSDHNSYFTQPKKEKKLSFSNLIVDLDFKKEFNAYRKEATEVTGQPANLALLPPSLEEASISSTLTEIGKLQTVIEEDAESLPECLRLLNKTTSQYITELDYAAEAVRDETNAKIKAQEEVINPKIASLNSEYKRRIGDLTRSFNQELETLEKLKARAEKCVENDEAKMRVYRREAENQASKKHLTYEKKWREKVAQTKKDLDGIKKEVKRIEKSIKNITKQKTAQTAKLQFELDAEIKHARQPLLDLERVRDAKMLVFKREAEKMIKLEKPVVDGLNSAVKLGEAIKAKFVMLGIVDPQLKSPALFYVPFYVACYQSGLKKRSIFLPPSTTNPVGFAAKLKGAFGRSKIKELFNPRFKSISILIGRVQVLSKRDHFLDDQIKDLGEKNNLLNTRLTRGNIAEGLVYLRTEGWLSYKEYQLVSNSLNLTLDRC
jgi:hypothetical protein